MEKIACCKESCDELISSD